MSNFRFRLGLFALVAIVQCSGAEIRVQISSTPDGVDFGWIGELPVKPAPTVFFFSGGIQDSFYPEAIHIFGPGVLCVAIDLPAHGADRRAEEPASIRGWRYRLDHGEDVTTDLISRARKVLDHLIAKQHTDPARVAVFGTSRGGFMAFHFAAADSRVKQVAAFAPVTDLMVLKEFHGIVDDQRASSLSASGLAACLFDRGIFIIIGNADHRVSTHAAIEFTLRVIEKAEARGRPPKIELHVGVSNGHECPAGSYPLAARWLLAQWYPPK